MRIIYIEYVKNTTRKHFTQAAFAHDVRKLAMRVVELFKNGQLKQKSFQKKFNEHKT